MPDRFNNETGEPAPPSEERPQGGDGVDDALADGVAAERIAQYNKNAAETNAINGPTPGSQAGDDSLEYILSTYSGLLNNSNDKTYEIDLQRSIPDMGTETSRYGDFSGREPDSAGPLHTSGMAQTGDYYELQSGGFLQLDNQAIRDLVYKAADKDPEKVEAIYQQALSRTAILNQAGKNITVAEVLNGFIKDGVPSSGASGGPFSTTNRSVSLTNEGNARTILQAALTGYLGRSATTQENKAFLKALNVQERANPTTTVTKGNTTGRVTDQSATTTGGFDRNDFADRFAKSQEGYAEYQTATTYLDAFIEGLEDQTRVIG